MSKPVLLSGGNGKASELAGTANGQFLVNNGSNEVVFSTATAPTAGQVPVWSGSAWAPGANGGSGTVTSVTLDAGSTGLMISAGYSQTITTSGTFTLSGTLGVGYGGTGVTLASANTIFAGPTTGADAAPAFRALVAADIPSLSATYLPLSGGTLTGKLITPASTTTIAGFNLPHGTAASTTVANGDLWTTTSGLFARISGVTQQFGALAITNSWTSNNTFSSATNSFGTGTATGTTGLATGPTVSAATKTVNIGTGGVAGSTTTITIGATAGTSTTALNGTVSATTAAVDTNTTQIATTAYVVGQGYLKSTTATSTYAPLDAPTFTGTVTIPAGASISGFAPLDSPTFSGTPSLPTGTAGVTQTAGDNTTALATTAFVTTAVAASSGIPYDLPAEIPGTPVTSTKVVNFKAVRAFILAITGHQGGQLTAPSGNFVCTVRKNATSLGTITFGVSSFSSSITGTLADRTFAAADVLSVETPAAALGIDTPFFTLAMTLA